MKIFVDSNIWLYALVEINDPRHGQAVHVLGGTGLEIVISTQVLAEVACNLLKKARVSESDICLRINHMEMAATMVGVDAHIHRQASVLRRTGSWSYWDSLIVAAALESGCTELWSEDLQHGRVVEGRLLIVNPLNEMTA